MQFWSSRCLRVRRGTLMHMYDYAMHNMISISNAIEEAVAANASASKLLAMLGAPPIEFGATSGWIGLPPSITTL